jgi:hypothetical protein
MSTVSIDRFVDLSELRRRDLAPFYSWVARRSIPS